MCFSHQAVQARAARGGGKLLRAVGAEAAAERVGDVAGGPAHSRRLRLTTTLENLQLHAEDVI